MDKWNRARLHRDRACAWSARGRPWFFIVLLITISTGCTVTPPPATPRPPNIVVILADDQGYGDIGAYGGEISTPQIDSIARQGVRFTSGYVAGPACVISRCGLLLGRNPARYQCQDHLSLGLTGEETTLADHLRDRGYATGIIGKWHLGDTPALRPMAQGFDEFFGFLGGLHLYLPDHEPGDAAFREFAVRHTGELYRNNTVVEERGYLTDAFAREAGAFIARHQTEPFFLYLSFNAVHIPLQATQKYLERIPPSAEDERRRTLAAMTSAMDDAVGSVLNTLRQLGLEEETLVFYLSDNGGDPFSNRSINDPLRGTKGELYEGGVRVPFMLQWKGSLPAGLVYQEPVSALDIAATALAASGTGTAVKPPLDGINLLPYLQQDGFREASRALYWRYRGWRALRLGDWKLLQTDESADWRLYNLGEDISEVHDLASEQRKLVVELQARLRQIEREYRAAPAPRARRLPPPSRPTLPIRGTRQKHPDPSARP